MDSFEDHSIHQYISVLAKALAEESQAESRNRNRNKEKDLEHRGKIEAVPID